MRLNFLEGGPNQFIIVKRKFNPNLLSLTFISFSSGMMNGWHIIRAAAFWKIIAKDPLTIHNLLIKNGIPRSNATVLCPGWYAGS